MSADPKPIQHTFVHASESAPASRDADRPVLALTLKAQRGMARVFFPEAISLPGFARISGDSEWYVSQNLLVAEDFIERLCSSGLDVFHRFRPQIVEPSRLRVGLNLAIPGIVEIDLAQTLEELGLVLLRQLFNRFDDFAHRAHIANLAETFCDEKGEEMMKSEL